MNTDRRTLWRRLAVSLGLGIVLMLGVSGLRTLHAQATDSTPAPAPVKGPDPTGAFTGTAADVAVKDAANPTLAEVMETVGHNKISINFVWVLITGFLVMFSRPGSRWSRRASPRRTPPTPSR